MSAASLAVALAEKLPSAKFLELIKDRAPTKDGAREQITDLIHAYMHALDAGDSKWMQSLFAEDASIEITAFGLKNSGLKEIGSFCTATHRRFERVMHSESNIYISFDGAGVARNLSYWSGFDTTTGTTVSVGTHEDTFVQAIESGRATWRFLHRRIIHKWATGGLPQRMATATDKAEAAAAHVAAATGGAAKAVHNSKDFKNAPANKKIRALYTYTSAIAQVPSFDRGDIFTVTGSAGEWYTVFNPKDGLSGAVPQNYFEEIEVTVVQPASSATAAALPTPSAPPKEFTPKPNQPQNQPPPAPNAPPPAY